MVDSLVKPKTNGRTSSDAVSRGRGCVRLRAGVATEVIAGHIGDWAVVVGVQADVLVVRADGGTVGHKVGPAVVSESGVGQSQQAASCCQVKVHDEIQSIASRIIDSVFCAVSGFEKVYQ